MGYWNEVCTLTRLPIREGDECVVVAYKGLPSFDVSTFHRVWLHTMFGTYDEYGWIHEYEKPTPTPSLMFFSRAAWEYAKTFQLIFSGGDQFEHHVELNERFKGITTTSTSALSFCKNDFMYVEKPHAEETMRVVNAVYAANQSFERMGMGRQDSADYLDHLIRVAEMTIAGANAIIEEDFEGL